MKTFKDLKFNDVVYNLWVFDDDWKYYLDIYQVDYIYNQSVNIRYHPESDDKKLLFRSNRTCKKYIDKTSVTLYDYYFSDYHDLIKFLSFIKQDISHLFDRIYHQENLVKS